jgi:hypothetical protein
MMSGWTVAIYRLLEKLPGPLDVRCRFPIAGVDVVAEP